MSICYNTADVAREKAPVEALLSSIGRSINVPLSTFTSCNVRVSVSDVWYRQQLDKLNITDVQLRMWRDWEQGLAALLCTTNQHFSATNSIACDEATFQVATIATYCHIVTWLRMPTTVAMSSAGSRIMLPPCKEEILLHPLSTQKVPSRSYITHASITNCFFVFLILSIMPRSSTSKHFPGTFIVPRWLCIKQNN